MGSHRPSGTGCAHGEAQISGDPVTRALARRLQALEARRGCGAFGESWIDQCLNDSTFLREQIRLHPGRVGSREAAIDAEILALPCGAENWGGKIFSDRQSENNAH